MQLQGFEEYSASNLATQINNWISGNLRDGYRIQLRNVKYQTMVNSEGISVYSALVIYDIERVS